MAARMVCGGAASGLLPIGFGFVQKASAAAPVLETPAADYAPSIAKGTGDLEVRGCKTNQRVKLPTGLEITRAEPRP